MRKNPMYIGEIKSNVTRWRLFQKLAICEHFSYCEKSFQRRLCDSKLKDTRCLCVNCSATALCWTHPNV